MLMVSTLNAEEIASRGIPVLDLYLLMQAEKQKKRVHAIERPDEHCDPLNQLSLDMVSYLLWGQMLLSTVQLFQLLNTSMGIEY